MKRLSQREKGIEQSIKQLKALLCKIPKRWDGKEAIREMKKCGNTHWKQMEWIGFYGEMKSLEFLRKKFVIPGTKYGNTQFDFKVQSGIDWDIKVHPINQRNAILNDQEAIDLAIDGNGYLGLVILNVDCEYERKQEFKNWHDKLKGSDSAYVRKGKQIGRRPRKRKKAATLKSISIFLLNKKRCKDLKIAQKGWKNSNGLPRRGKYSITHQQIMQFSENPMP